MKFGKDFRNHLEETLPEWRDKFLCYKPLKKLIKHHLPPELPVPAQPQSEAAAAAAALIEDRHRGEDDEDVDHRRSYLSRLPPPPPTWDGLQDWFVGILNEEMEKFNDFYVDKEEEFVIRLQELKERIEQVRISRNGDFTSEREFSEELLEIRKAFVTIHGEMVLLKNYSSLNFAGLVKILKKYDKRTGGLLSLPFTQRALHQPFFTTEPLTGLVRECEANLELLFPSEAEVIESSTHATGDKCDGRRNTEASCAREETDDLYRSTRAAIKAIEGLRRASSTYNPLSLAQYFNDQDDDDDSGAITAENSTSNSPAPLQQNVKEADQGTGQSGDG